MLTGECQALAWKIDDLAYKLRFISPDPSEDSNHGDVRRPRVADKAVYENYILKYLVPCMTIPISKRLFFDFKEKL